MVKAIAVFLCAALAACNQTATPARTAQAPARQPAAKAEQPPAITADMPPEEQYATLMVRCEAAIRREQQKSIAAARVGSALSMVGGFAGIGGAIAGEAISAGRSLAQAGVENSARTAIEKECTP